MGHNNRSALQPKGPSLSTTRVGDLTIPPPPRFSLVPWRSHDPTACAIPRSSPDVRPRGAGPVARGRARSDATGSLVRREGEHQHGGCRRAPNPAGHRQGVRRENRRVPSEERPLQEGRGPRQRPRDRREDLREDQGSADDRQELSDAGRCEGGFSLTEAALALVLLGLVLAAATPALFAALSRGRVAAAARDLEQQMARLRSEAIASHHDVAMRLTWSGGRYQYAFYADGDGDGVRSNDIASGRDPLIGEPHDLPDRYEGIDFGLLPEAIPEVPPGSGVLPPGSDPVRFGRSDIITFTPRGTSSSGTLYLSDGQATVAAVVVYGATGRLRLWRFDRDRWVWTR